MTTDSSTGAWTASGTLLFHQNQVQAARAQVQRYLSYDPMSFNDSRKQRDITSLGRPARNSHGRKFREVHLAKCSLQHEKQIFRTQQMRSFRDSRRDFALLEITAPASVDAVKCLGASTSELDDPVPISTADRGRRADSSGKLLVHIPLRFRLCGAPQVKMGTPQNEAAGNFEFESSPQDSRFGSWKVSLFRDVLSRSIHPLLVGEWSAEIDHATSMDDLDHSGIVLLTLL